MKSPAIKVLCVDDEANVLEGFRRHLRKKFELHTANSGREGLEVLAKEGPFAVIVSDLRMPGMDGIEFLAAVRERAEETTRMLLTGDADLSAAMAAVNEGNIYRFLAKPCPPVELIQAIQAGAKQHRLVTGERELLEKTLFGSIKMLTEVLALANPTAFGRATRVQHKAGELARRIGSPAPWQMEMAAMLSQVACITLPQETLERLVAGKELTKADRTMVDRLPTIAQGLLKDIPRIEDVKLMLRHQKGELETTTPIGAKILRFVLELDVLQAKGVPYAKAVEQLRARDDGCLAEVLAAAEEGELEGQGVKMVERSIKLASLSPGMILVDALVTQDGRLLVAEGNEVTRSLLLRVRNFADKRSIKQPFRVLAPEKEEAPEPAAV